MATFSITSNRSTARAVGGQSTARVHKQMRHLLLSWTISATIGTFLVGCGNRSPTQAIDRSAANHLPACAPAAEVVSLPPEFPSAFPLPPGTVATLQQRLNADYVLVGAIVPSDIQTATRFFLRELPAAGFELIGGDAEMDEAESSYRGHGYQGQWKVHSIIGCPNAVTLTVIARR